MLAGSVKNVVIHWRFWIIYSCYCSCCLHRISQNSVYVFLPRQAALESEKARALRIVALPPPPKDPVDLIEPVKCM